MRNIRRLAPLALLLACATVPVSAEEPVAVLDLPFKATALRGPGSEVALGVSTSGLLPIAKPKPASADPKAAPPRQDEVESAPVVVVWGEGGGAVLSLDGGAVRTTLIGAEAVEGLVAAETPRGAVPGSRRALSGPLSAYLSGPTRGDAGATGQAAGLTIRERQPLGVTGEPKPVPIRTATLSAGAGAVFAARPPRIAWLDGRPRVLAVTQSGPASSALVMAGKDAGRDAGKGADGGWSILARSPPQAGRAGGAPLTLVGVADFAGNGRPQVAALREPDGAGVLQLWSIADGALTLAAEAPGFGGPASANGEAAAVIPAEPGAAPELALPAADRSTLVVVACQDGCTGGTSGGIAERARLLLPAPVGAGLAALGRGAGARLVVALSDGRVAVVPARLGAEVRP